MGMATGDPTKVVVTQLDDRISRIVELRDQIENRAHRLTGLSARVCGACPASPSIDEIDSEPGNKLEHLSMVIDRMAQGMNVLTTALEQLEQSL